MCIRGVTYSRGIRVLAKCLVLPHIHSAISARFGCYVFRFSILECVCARLICSGDLALGPGVPFLGCADAVYENRIGAPPCVGAMASCARTSAFCAIFRIFLRIPRAPSGKHIRAYSSAEPILLYEELLRLLRVLELGCLDFWGDPCG